MRKCTLFITALVWCAAVAAGLRTLWSYESAPGDIADAPLRLPADPTIARSSNLASLILFIHPKCPCSRATIGELARLMTECSGKLTATVLMLRPASELEGW